MFISMVSGPEKTSVLKIFILLVALSLSACDYPEIKVYVQNESSKQLIVEYKKSNEWHLTDPQEKVLDVAEKELLFKFEYWGDTSLDKKEDCQPFRLEYVMFKNAQGELLYSQNPTDPSVWTCSIKSDYSLCVCLLMVTDDMLKFPDEQSDSDSIEETD